MKRKLEIGLSLLIGTSVFGGCNNDLAPIRQSQTFPPNLNAPTVFESFSPDSGGVKTQLIIRGQNFGTDTAYLKVTVNNKRAAIVGVADDVIYAIVPARADTGYVRLFVGKDDNVEEYASQTKFIYQFKRNVTTLMGRQGQSGRDDGPYAECKLQRPTSHPIPSSTSSSAREPGLPGTSTICPSATMPLSIYCPHRNSVLIWYGVSVKSAA